MLRDNRIFFKFLLLKSRPKKVKSRTKLTIFTVVATTFLSTSWLFGCLRLDFRVSTSWLLFCLRVRHFVYESVCLRVGLSTSWPKSVEWVNAYRAQVYFSFRRLLYFHCFYFIYLFHIWSTNKMSIHVSLIYIYELSR